MDLSALRSTLRRAKLRATPARLEVLRTLARRPRPMSVRELHTRLERFGVDTVTVYRMMEDFVRAGLVRRIDLGKGHAQYEYDDPEHHHHHLVCERCDRVQDVQLEGEERILAQMQQRHGFRTAHHTVEFIGLCAHCQ